MYCVVALYSGHYKSIKQLQLLNCIKKNNHIEKIGIVLCKFFHDELFTTYETIIYWRYTDEEFICSRNGVPLSVSSKVGLHIQFTERRFQFKLHVYRKTYYDFVIHSFFIILFRFFNRKSAKALIILISLLGMIYLLVFYLSGNNSSNVYFVAVVYPLQVR